MKNKLILIRLKSSLWICWFFNFFPHTNTGGWYKTFKASPKFFIYRALLTCTDIKTEFVCLFVCFYGISTFVGNLMPNPFYANKQFYFKQFSLV